MADRPKWARAIHSFISDGIFDEPHGFPMDGSDDEIHSRIEDAMNAAMCAEYGHYVMFDQCGLPEHRSCGWCGMNIADLKLGPKDTIEEPRRDLDCDLCVPESHPNCVKIKDGQVLHHRCAIHRQEKT
jgi:hypothetical protein